MKKMYLNPTLEIVEIAVEAGIAASGGVIIPPAPGGGGSAGDLTPEGSI
ncbi:MAG: hypothetical protein RRZ64_05725 [Rikenellaceae bacterium]